MKFGGIHEEGHIVSYVNQAKSHPTMWWDRADPYYDISHQGSQGDGTWEAISAYRKSVSLDHRIGALKATERPIFTPIFPRNRVAQTPELLRTVAFFNSYQDASTAQVAAFLGVSIEEAAGICNKLFVMGILRRFAPRDSRYDDEDFGLGYSLYRQSWTFESWLTNLPSREYALVTQGSDPLTYEAGSASISAFRHNISIVDIMLKAHEVNPSFAGAWGERWARGELLVREGAEVDMSRGKVGDGVMVGVDGSIIIIEFVGSQMKEWSAREAIAEKAESWAKVIALSPHNVKILFVHGSLRSRLNWSFFNEFVRKGIMQAQGGLVTKRQAEKMADSIFAVDYRWWFPEPRSISTSFRELEALHVMNNQVVPLLPLELPRNYESDVVINTLGALHTPEWVTNKFEAV